VSRFRVTIRGDGTEIRGYATIEAMASLTSPPGEQPYMVIASPAEDDFDPFAITEPDYPPTPERSFAVITELYADSENIVDFMERLSVIHFGQANVIRGESYLRERAEAELRDRELHHFETEQMVAGAAVIADSLEKNWEQGDLAGAVNEAIGFLRGMKASNE